MQPLSHDTADEIAQPTIADWRTGECEAIPGKTMPRFKVVERDYTKLYEQMISLGEGIRNNGVGAHGLQDAGRRLLRRAGPQATRRAYPRHRHANGGVLRPSLKRGRQVRRGDPGARPGQQRRVGLPGLRGRGGQDRAAR